MIKNDWVGGYSWGNSEYAAGCEAIGATDYEPIRFHTTCVHEIKRILS